MGVYLHEVAVWYGKCLNTGIGPGKAPAFLWILIICPTALLIAFVLWLPVHTALQNGVPISGYIHTVDKHGNPETDSIQSIVNIDIAILIICVPLLVSTLAYLLGWLGRSDENDLA